MSYVITRIPEDDTKSLSHAGKKGMKWGYNDGKANGNRTAMEQTRADLESLPNVVEPFGKVADAGVEYLSDHSSLYRKYSELANTPIAEHIHNGANFVKNLLKNQNGDLAKRARREAMNLNS